MKRIHEDHNGVRVCAVEEEGDTNVTGHVYELEDQAGRLLSRLEFQFGGVQENGVNGLTSEALLAILIHRTRTMNDKFPSAYNTLALEGLHRALGAFEARTADRLGRKVEGTEQA